MSIPQYAPKEVKLGTGSLDAYTFDFLITHKSELLVVEVDDNGVETQRVRGTDTSYLTDVTFDAVEGGGTVTLAANLPSGYNLILLQANDEPIQDYRFRDKASFNLRRFENAFDYVMATIQRLVYRGKQALRLHDLDDEDAFNTQLPPGIADNASRVIQIDDAGTGLEYGPTTTEIANAQAYAEAASDSADAAAASEDVAQAGAEQAQFLLFDGELTISNADSPFTIVDPTHNSKIIKVNASLGDVVINLPQRSSLEDTFKVQFIRTDDSVNVVTINPYAGDTIGGNANYILPLGLALILAPEDESTDNWITKLLGVSNGGGSVPASALEGDYLEADSSGDAVWTSGTFDGFSARFGQAFSALGVRDAINKILDFTYLAPQISLSMAGSGTIREKGSSLASSLMTASTTKRTDPIAKVEFFRGGVEIAENDPATYPNGGSEQYNETTPITDTTSFYARVTDDGTSGGPSTIQSNTVTFNFVYPYYHGCGAPSLSAANVALLTKSVIAENTNLSRSFTSLDTQVYYFAYPASYGTLSQILDVNAFDVTADWTLRVENITGLDSTPVSYNIYEFNNPVLAGSTTFTFKQ